MDIYGYILRPVDKFGYTTGLVMREIYIHPGRYMLVSDCDYERLAYMNWSISPTGYVWHARSCTYVHRKIMNPPAGIEVDHINGNPLDNRRSNLRLATRAQNTRNRKKPIRGVTSQYKGVTWDKSRNKWLAAIGFSGRRINLGRFVLEIDAALAYDRAAIRYFGEFARLNFPNHPTPADIAA